MLGPAEPGVETRRLRITHTLSLCHPSTYFWPRRNKLYSGLDSRTVRAAAPPRRSPRGVSTSASPDRHTYCANPPARVLQTTSWLISLPCPRCPRSPRRTNFACWTRSSSPRRRYTSSWPPVLSGQTFTSYGGLIDAVGGRMSALCAANSPTDRDILHGILGSHPRLGRAPANPEHLSELSKKEQAQLNTGAEEQAEKLAALNAEYEAKFPGLRFVLTQAHERRYFLTPPASDVASGSSNSQNDGQRNSRRPAGGPLVRQSTSHTLQETRAESNAIDPLSQTDPRRRPCANVALFLSHHRYRVSLLNRIIGKKNNPLSEPEDETSETEENRMSADQSHPTSFIPRHLAPARYLKVRAHYKKDKTFDHVFEAQELQGAAPERPADRRKSASSNISKGESHGKAIWALAFSKDGRYLAAAGQDRKVRVWAVITSAEEREMAKLERETSPDGQDPVHLYAPVFQSNPIQVYEAHTGSILDLSWSKLRLWSIPDKNVAYVTTVPDMITSVAFTPDGRHSLAGCLNGLLSIHDTEGLKLSGQIHVRSARGRNSKGAKITGIDTIKVPQDDPNGDVKVLVTSNDSRIRLYDLRDRVLEAKFRGNENTCSQIRASFTDDGKHVICGSEDRRTYVWPIESPERDADKRPVEVFETQSTIVTVAITAPARAKQLLSLITRIYGSFYPYGRQHHRDSRLLGQDKNPSTRLRISETPLRELGSAQHYLSAHPASLKLRTSQCRLFHWQRFYPEDTLRTHHLVAELRRSPGALQPRGLALWTAQSQPLAASTGHNARLPALFPVLPVWAPARHYRASPLHQGRRQCDLVRSGDRQPQKNGQRADDRASQELQDLPASSAELIYSDKTQENPLWLQGDHSYAYWQKITQDAMAIKSRQSNDTDLLNPNHIPPGLERKLSTAGSVLSSEYESSAVAEDEEDLMRCENCLGTSFRGVKDRSGKQKLICSSCNRLVS
ncbi:Oxo-4-hydroxy-4-carboxy-5-ureidoimidazoline decarboxylase [Penicillium chermesinum]|uniref:Oxo-4-hydroxy-4-carboxy-5-ureidoimidazoline decarboxylase n=1 Tax=Penicillium chermesinum TaxID=63820 RepID=A0A9W9TYC9_9EURO|nr:Oxo-4-hydroxy-4-carboxy-5-ureidoimidazoline decarboxylase [Penicillium chermesinum]KAJ5246174.1 Oxo-4-hydroxy-4-carboxy-5-ureidoimidazoline decarboxylase [Penicillium chermesinum]